MPNNLFKRERFGVAFAYIWTSLLCALFYWLLIRVGQQPFFMANVVAGGTWVLLVLAMTLGFKKRYSDTHNISPEDLSAQKRLVLKTASYAGIFSMPGLILLILALRKITMGQTYLPLLLAGMVLMVASSFILFFKLRPLKKD